ncbi:MAG: YceI family protein, partial [Candidatus Saccharimonadales bacterium]
SSTMETKKWVSDQAHSELQFKVKHLMITNVTGDFTDFNVETESESPDFQDAKIKVTIKTDSVKTGPADRDKHLKSADFFDTEKYPEIKFVSTRFRKVNEDGGYVLEGNLTIKDVTTPVSLNVEYGGSVKDPWGNVKSAFSVQGKISRKDWGLNYNAALETGGVVVSDEVRILAEVQMTVVVEEPAEV